MAEVATGTPTAPADTSAAAAAAPAPTTPAGAQGNPGGASAYGAGLASTGVNVFQGLVEPTGNMPTSLPSDLEQATFPDIIPGSPAHQRGFGKGSTRPDISRLSDLVKLGASIASGQMLQHQPGMGPSAQFSDKLLDDVFRQAGLSGEQQQQLKEGGAGGDQIASLSAGMHKAVQSAYTTIWRDINTHLESLGVAVPDDLRQPPNPANMISKLKALGNIPLEHPLVDALQRNGYETSNMVNVSSLISGHDSQQFVTGSKGLVTTIPGTPAHAGDATGAALWDDFVTKWNTNQKVQTDPLTGAARGGVDYRTAVLTDLVAAGAIDLSSGNPTDAEIANAYQQVMASAAGDKLTLPQEFQKLFGSIPAETNLDQAYVQHVADQILGPNVLTPFQAKALTNMASKVGTGSSAAADLINEGIVSIYLNDLQNGGNPISTGSSYAAMAYQTINDTLTQWGVPTTPAQIAKLAGTVLQSGINTPYQVVDLAKSNAESFAKGQVGHLYGAGVGAQANAGIDVATQAAPYLQSASQLLGTPTSEMALADPTGKWMKWSSGGTGPGGTMTQAEWAQYVMHDPTYNFDQSQTSRNEMAAGANGLLTLFGKLPSTAPNPFGSASLASQFGAQ